MFLKAGSVAGEAQHGASCLGQRCGLVFGAPREAAPQEVGDGGITALLPALRRQEEEEEEPELTRHMRTFDFNVEFNVDKTSEISDMEATRRMRENRLKGRKNRKREGAAAEKTEVRKSKFHVVLFNTIQSRSALSTV